MDTIKFMKMDFMTMRTQTKLIGALAIVVCILTNKVLNESMGTWGIMYMIFMGIVLASMPFTVDMTILDGFVRLLPAKASSRVYGRYLFGVIFLILCSVVGVCLSLPVLIKQQISMGYVLSITAAYLGAGCFTNSLQYVFSYFFNIKNPQMLSIIRLIPGFAFFFGGSILASMLEDVSSGVVGRIGDVLNFLMKYYNVFSWGILLVSLVFTILCAYICGKREEHREM